MGERKVLNKYFPPDFDPSKIQKGKRVRSEEKQMKVRMMLPMSVQCNTCGNFMYKGTKFNTRMEDVKGEDYLGIKIFRFYYKCTNCAAEFCMKTDPKSTDYIVEAGATRNYEPWRDNEQQAEHVRAQREEEEKGNAMKALENRTIDSKREMDILTALDEMKSLKARHEGIDAETALTALKRAAEAEELVDLDAEDEEAVQRMLLQRAGFVKRLSSDDDDDDDGKERKKTKKGIVGGGKRAVGAGAIGAALWEDGDGDGEGIEDGGKERNSIEDGGKERNSAKDKHDIPVDSLHGMLRAGDGDEAKTKDDDKSHKKESKNKNRGASAGGSSVTSSSVPLFAGGAAAVIVKSKPKETPATKTPSSNTGDGDILAGLMAYGSDSGTD